MSYDDIIEVLAAALLEKAETVGCLEVLDGFSPVSYTHLTLPTRQVV